LSFFLFPSFHACGKIPSFLFSLSPPLSPLPRSGMEMVKRTRFPPDTGLPPFPPLRPFFPPPLPLPLCSNKIKVNRVRLESCVVLFSVTFPPQLLLDRRKGERKSPSSYQFPSLRLFFSFLFPFQRRAAPFRNFFFPLPFPSALAAVKAEEPASSSCSFLLSKRFGRLVSPSYNGFFPSCAWPAIIGERNAGSCQRLFAFFFGRPLSFFF